MDNNNLLKALQPYSQAYICKIIWGEVTGNYRTRIHRRLSGKVEFEKLEREKIIEFLKAQKKQIESVLIE